MNDVFMKRLMTDPQKRIKVLAKAIHNWFEDDDGYLEKAVHKTVDKGYFGLRDIQFALKALKKNISRETLDRWVEHNDIVNNDAGGQNVLCLHAGNLPLVGFQDILAVLLSGARYTGKISRKNPYLLPTFLNEVKKTAIWSGVDVQWSHRLDDFEGMQNDYILFAGSERSLPGVRKALDKFKLVQPDTRFLIRTAHFSLAYFDKKERDYLNQLTEAILRYGGRGCRSVAVVVSPFSLDELRDDLKGSARDFWKENPQFLKPEPKLLQQFAYNQAIGRSQIWLKDFLLQESRPGPDMDFICYWIRGDEQKAGELANEFGGQLQSVYVADQEVFIRGFEEKTELLSEAQQPPIYWQPDGVDTLGWLARNGD
jgi:hypothetical protein